jgi:acetyl esterase/lipase
MKTRRKALAVLGAATLLLAALAASSPLGALNALSPTGASRRIADIAYAGGARHQLDVYVPNEASKPAPVLVFFFGGNWTSGAREEYAFVGRALASRGYVVVIPDYRLYPEVRYPDFLDDAAQAVAWTRRDIAQYGGDPDRMFLMGHSAGAYNAAMLALDGRYLARHGMQSSSLRGWIGLAGPYDFIPVVNPTARPVFHFPDTPRDSQPVNHVTAAAPPALLIAPEHDKLVNPARNTGGLAQRLRGEHVAVSEIYFPRVSHTTLVGSLAAPLRFLAPTLDTIDRFIAGNAARPLPAK